MSIDRQWHIIGRGKAGWHATGINTSSSGGDLNPYTYWTGAECAGYAAEAIEGALLYDAEWAEFNAFAHLIISGPMVDPKLPPDGIELFGDQETAARMAPHLGGAFKTIATAAASESFGGFDKVGVGIYERLLRAVPGMRIGRVINGLPVWEEPCDSK